MHIQEAEWISEKLLHETIENISPMLNVGSSTEEFRVTSQPHIESMIFKPLRGRGVKIVHQDIKAAPGVDIVGDLTEPLFLERLRRMQFKSILCSNLLEHLVNRTELANALLEILAPGGSLIVTVPSRYPKHMDPIDTMYRPKPNELVSLFPGMEIKDTALIDVGTVWRSLRHNWGKFLKLLIRAAMPFYRYNGWITVINKLLWLGRRRMIACVFLKKPGNS